MIAEVVEQGRGPKMIVFKYKPKTRYRRRRGHRQGYTRLVVRQILTEKGPPKAEEKPKRRRPSKAEAEPKPARRTRARKPKAEAAPVEAQEAEAKPAPRSRARKPTAKSETKKPKRTSTKTERD